MIVCKTPKLLAFANLIKRPKSNVVLPLAELVEAWRHGAVSRPDYRRHVDQLSQPAAQDAMTIDQVYAAYEEELRNRLARMTAALLPRLADHC
jgi:hypothetical protein